VISPLQFGLVCRLLSFYEVWLIPRVMVVFGRRVVLSGAFDWFRYAWLEVNRSYLSLCGIFSASSPAFLEIGEEGTDYSAFC